MRNITLAIIAAAVASIFVYLDGAKNESWHGMHAESCQQQITTVPYELRWYYLIHRPEQKI